VLASRFQTTSAIHSPNQRLGTRMIILR
jgi:hypothetical protein